MFPALLGLPRGSGSVTQALAAGWYHKDNQSTPTSAGLDATADKLHDVGAGDTTTGYSTTPDGTVRYFWALRVYASQKTFDEIKASPGWLGSVTYQFFGSNDGTNWTEITFLTEPSFGSHLSFSFEAGSWTSPNEATFKMIGMVTISTAGADAQAGSADYRIYESSVEVPD